ncbi:hypothetical protein MUU53_19680 [Rhizobium lemnae]|uniref:Uncharacterized protein n=1 Tax=Rhizobium lemnae TaxID=1214924 RepID=A0ABV8EC03_9HYPH|nr:hypothetical protein [Rhizobium lemnae]MCJ8510117.1 hypothetical protein [Rhizobium lemnae]
MRYLTFLVLPFLLLETGTAWTIDWGNAGRSTEVKPVPGQSVPLPPTNGPQLPDGSFNCDTVTRMSWEQSTALENSNVGPRQVRRCSRDGLSIEVTPPSN